MESLLPPLTAESFSKMILLLQEQRRRGMTPLTSHYPFLDHFCQFQPFMQMITLMIRRSRFFNLNDLALSSCLNLLDLCNTGLFFYTPMWRNELNVCHLISWIFHCMSTVNETSLLLFQFLTCFCVCSHATLLNIQGKVYVYRSITNTFMSLMTYCFVW